MILQRTIVVCGKEWGGGGWKGKAHDDDGGADDHCTDATHGAI